MLEELIDFAGVAFARFVDEGDDSGFQRRGVYGDFFKAGLEVLLDLGFTEALQLKLIAEPGKQGGVDAEAQFGEQFLIAAKA